MEEEIKVFDDDLNEYEKEKEDEVFHEKRVTVGDVITIQLILCILIVITIIVLNIITPDVTDEVVKYAKSQIDKSYQMSPQMAVAVEKIKEILNV